MMNEAIRDQAGLLILMITVILTGVVVWLVFIFPEVLDDFRKRRAQGTSNASRRLFKSSSL